MNFQQLSEWLTDIRIPGALSNEENQFLEESIEAKVKDFSSIQLDIEENLDRIRMLEDHRRLVQDELQIIQRLLTACRTEGTNERSSINIDTTEMKRLERLIENAEIDLQRLIQRKNGFQEEIDQLHREISKIEQDTQGEKENFDKFIEITRKRDEEIFSLMKYTREDDLRIKELTTELERYSQQSLRLKRATEEEYLEYSGLQISLDKISNQFRQSHHHRQELLHRWEIILNQMQHKDENIHRLAQQLIQTKRTVRMKEHQLNEQKIFFEREQKNNHILEKFIHLTNQKLMKLKNKEQSGKERQESTEKDILSLKSVLINTQNQIQRERMFINQLQSTILSKHQHRTKLQEYYQELLERKSFILNSKYSTEEKLSQLDKSFEFDRHSHEQLHHHHTKLTEEFFHLNNDLSQIRRHEQQTQLANRTSENQLDYLQNQLTKFDQQLFQQQELIYHQDFQKQTIDRRLNRLLVEKNNDNLSQSEEKLRQLREDDTKRKSHRDQLENQMKILHEELRLIKHQSNELITEKTHWQDQLIQFDLYNTLTEKMIKKLNTEKEDYLVEENLLNIELKRLKTLLGNSSEVNCTLEQQRIELHKAIKERRMEVQANSHLFRLRFNDERTKKVTISTELAVRITKIEKLKHRYETIAMNSTINTARNQAQYVIESALIKEDLFRQGDQLESLVIKAESELRALENTVQILKWNNRDVKKNFEKLNPSSLEICEMKKLEEHLRAMTEQVKLRRKLLLEVRSSIDDCSRKSSQSDDNQRMEAKLVEEIEQYQMKIDRADQLIKRYRRNSSEIDQNEFDVDIRLLRETNDKLEQQITSIGDTIESISTKKSHRIFSTITPNLVQISIDHRKTTTTKTAKKAK